MIDRRTFGEPVRRGIDILRSHLRLVLFAAVGLPVAALLVGAVAFHLSWTAGNVDADIPLDRARKELAELLRLAFGVTLDPSARIVAAHEERGGLQGDGSKWYLVRLAPGQGPHFEADFLDHARATPWPCRLEPLEAKAIDRAIIQALGWKSGPPLAVRAWRLFDRRSSCAIFFDDQFYCLFEHS